LYFSLLSIVAHKRAGKFFILKCNACDFFGLFCEYYATLRKRFQAKKKSRRKNKILTVEDAARPEGLFARKGRILVLPPLGTYGDIKMTDSTTIVVENGNTVYFKKK
jgi:hypothetical protein